MAPKDFLFEYLIITLSYKAIAKKLLLPNGPVKKAGVILTGSNQRFS